MMKIFHLEISKYTYSDFLKEITDFVLEESDVRGKAIFTPNPEICLKTLEDTEFLKVLNTADYLTSDGIGLYLGYQINDFHSLCKREYPKGEGLFKVIAFFMLPIYVCNLLFRKKFLYKKYWERICGSDLTNSLILFAQENNIKVAILDPDNPQDIQKCESQKTFRDKLSVKFPKLDFDFYIYSDENSSEIFHTVQESGAQILFSTLGMKRQELSVIQWLESCPNLKLGLGIGSSFDYYTWFQKRAPKIFRTLGFEWLYRIFTSPKKLQRLGRIFGALIIFPIKVITDKK